MLVRRRLSIAAFVFCATLLTLSTVQAGKPIPSGKDAPTEAKWQEEVYHWRLKEIDSYKKLTKDPPDIRDKTVQFLNGYLQRAFQRPEAPSWERLEKQADYLSDRGGKDPFVQMCRGDVKIHRNKPKDGIPLARSAYEDIASTGYSPFLKFQACYNWYLAAKSKPQFAKDFEDSSEELVSSIVTLLEATAEQPKEQKFVWGAISDLVARFGPPNEKATAIHNAIHKAVHRAEKLNPWMKQMLAGSEHFERAQRARGTGFINTVSPNDLRTFSEEMQQAAECFTKAWELDPTVPDAPARMIRVVGAAGIGSATTREWFDRAVEARMDYQPAYEWMMIHLLPQWGGSPEELEQFATECADTKRFDTKVPFFYILTLHGFDEHLGAQGKAWFMRGAYAKAKAVLEGMEKEPNRSTESLKKYPPEWIFLPPGHDCHQGWEIRRREKGLRQGRQGFAQGCIFVRHIQLPV